MNLSEATARIAALEEALGNLIKESGVFFMEPTEKERVDAEVRQTIALLNAIQVLGRGDVEVNDDRV